ncbi:Reverse transcriptase domain [Trinorchestia longiramus]|nr:Reverse transcriptase domain [Trinorchestia longiramus]
MQGAQRVTENYILFFLTIIQQYPLKCFIDGNKFTLHDVNLRSEFEIYGHSSGGEHHCSRCRTGWKWGIWLPIRKPGKDPEQVSSYRPKWLLSCIGKLMERMIQRRLEYWVETNNLLLGEQAGFRRGKSTMDSLLIAKDFIANTFSRKQMCIAVYLDLDGAYDSVWHEGIIYKLIASGLEKTYVKWLKNYLTGRTVWGLCNQRVCLSHGDSHREQFLAHCFSTSCCRTCQLLMGYN